MGGARRQRGGGGASSAPPAAAKKAARAAERAAARAALPAPRRSLRLVRLPKAEIIDIMELLLEDSDSPVLPSRLLGTFSAFALSAKLSLACKAWWQRVKEIRAIAGCINLDQEGVGRDDEDSDSDDSSDDQDASRQLPGSRQLSEQQSVQILETVAGDCTNLRELRITDRIYYTYASLNVNGICRCSKLEKLYINVYMLKSSAAIPMATALTNLRILNLIFAFDHDTEMLGHYVPPPGLPGDHALRTIAAFCKQLECLSIQAHECIRNSFTNRGWRPLLSLPRLGSSKDRKSRRLTQARRASQGGARRTSQGGRAGKGAMWLSR